MREHDERKSDVMDMRRKLAMGQKEEEHLKIYGGVGKRIGMRTYLHDQVECAEK